MRENGCVGQALKQELTRRRALLITPFAFAGLVAISTRKGEDPEPEPAASSDKIPELTIVQFNDAGQRLGPVRVRKVVHSATEWRRLLTREQYYVMRQAGTDTAFSGTYYQMHRAGVYRCAGCGDALFSSEAKFDSGTGWPSFTEPSNRANVVLDDDFSYGMRRTEVNCAVCGGHLGHVFNDGPGATGERFCINSVSLTLDAADTPDETDS